MKKILLPALFAVVLLLGQTAFAQIQPPSNLTAVQVNQGDEAAVQLAWSPSAAANVKYKLYKKHGSLTGTGSFKVKASKLTDTTFFDEDETPGDTLCYYVVAYKDTLLSQPSNTVMLVVAEPPSIKGFVKGVVLEDSTGLPLRKVQVKFISAYRECQEKDAYTDSTGYFFAEVDSGKYFIAYRKNGYVTEYFDNVNAIQYATAVHLLTGDTVSANASLAKYWPAPTYTLKGKVTDTLGNAVQATVRIFKLRTNTFHWSSSSTKTDNQGNYTFNVRGGDTVIVYAQPKSSKDYYAEYWDNKKTFDLADRIGISGNVTGINLALDKKPTLPNGINGTVKDTAGNIVVAHIAFYRVKNGHPEKKYTVVTDSLGVYSLTNMSVGKYILKAVPAADYKATYFKYDGSTTLNWRNADSVMVDSLHVVNNINFVVRAMNDTGFGRIAGVIKGSKNEVIPGAFVYLLDAKNQVFSFAAADKNGKYIIEGIIPGTYNVVTDYIDYNPTTIQNVVVNYTGNMSQTLPMSIVPFSVTDVRNESETALAFELLQNYPNPFNPSTTITFSLAEKSGVRLAVYDMLGKEVAVLADGTMNSGTYSVVFDGAKLASGVYLYKLSAGSLVITKKLVLMK